MSKAQELLEAINEAAPEYKEMNKMINQISFGKDKGKDVSKMEKDAEKLMMKMEKEEMLSPNSLKELRSRLDKAMAK